MLGAAISNGWSAEALTKLARELCITPKDTAHRYAISRAASKRFVTDQEHAADKAESEAIWAALAARRAIKATKDNRPFVPHEFKAFCSACLNMDDCDNLVSLVEGGWTADDLTTIAERVRRGTDGKPTPGAMRFTLSTANSRTPGKHLMLTPPINQARQ